MFVSIDKSDDQPIKVQLYKKIKDSILQGIIPSNTKVPSTRALARELQIARSTVVECYEQLSAEGYLYGKEGSGTFVSDGLVFKVSNPRTYKEKTIKDKPLYELPKGFISFRPGVPDLSTIPIRQWGRLYRDITVQVTTAQLDYCGVFGSWTLRSTLASYLKRVRGVETTPENILITGGAAQAFSLLSKLVNKDEFIIIEEPASTGMLQTFKGHSIRCKTVPIDEQGLVTKLLPKEPPTLILTTPSHQFPMGTIMSIKRRIELINYAKEKQAYVVEDDYDSEFRYEGNPIISMQNLAPEQVIYVGTFSKTFMPAIRMGYMILPDALVDRMKRYKYISDLHSPVLEQLTMAKFIEEGMMDRHIRRKVKRYGKRRNMLVQKMRETFGNKVTISGDGAGLHFIAAFEGIVEKNTLEERLNREKIVINNVSDYYLHQEQSRKNHFIIGFGNLQDHDIEEGIRRLNKALYLDLNTG